MSQALREATEIRQRLRNPANAVVDRPIELRRREPAPSPVFHVKPQVIHTPIPAEPIERAQACLLAPRRHERWPGETLKNQEEAMLSTLARALSIRQIKRVVAAYFDVEVGEIESHCRTARIVHIRHVAMYLTKVVTGRSLPEIGKHYGRRDHTTVLHAVRKIERQKAGDPDLAKAIEQLKTVLQPQERE